ncbi:hypothetical protein [Brevibacterium otitidis]|uniref:Uncharacterized protein n=1 Tax=Brevibacterium otitidis TaxID=53364 RepID=A0ABV5WZX4_9MICO
MPADSCPKLVSAFGNGERPPGRGGRVDVATGLLLDGDYLGAAVAESKGDVAVDLDGAFVEQSDAEVWAEDQLFKIKVGCLLPVVSTPVDMYGADDGLRDCVRRFPSLLQLPYWARADFEVIGWA